MFVINAVAPDILLVNVLKEVDLAEAEAEAEAIANVTNVTALGISHAIAERSKNDVIDATPSVISRGIAQNQDQGRIATIAAKRAISLAIARKRPTILAAAPTHRATIATRPGILLAIALKDPHRDETVTHAAKVAI